VRLDHLLSKELFASWFGCGFLVDASLWLLLVDGAFVGCCFPRVLLAGLSGVRSLFRFLDASRVLTLFALFGVFFENSIVCASVFSGFCFAVCLFSQAM
jgi:hypothetical protein